MNSRSKLFYAHDMVFSSGKKYIVSQMCGQQSNTQLDIYNIMSTVEVDYQISMSRFVCNLTRSQQKAFGEIMGLIKNIYIEKSVKAYSKLPETYADIRRMYLDGDVAITKQIPIPGVKLNNDHSIVSIMDCVADFVIRSDNLVNDVDDWDSILNLNNINHSLHLFKCNRVKLILRQAKNRVEVSDLRTTDKQILPLFITIWSDDFDPNKSIKNNRQSVWIKTISIFTMNKFGVKTKITYPVSLAMKGCNHDSVDFQHSLELSSLNSGEPRLMYSKTHNDSVYIHADIFSILNDQPERRGNLDLANGNSIIHGRFGLLIDSRQVKDAIRSCQVCSKSILMEAMADNQTIKYEWRDKSCNACSSWMFNLEHKLLRYTPEKDFPTMIHPNLCSDGKLPPRNITRTGIDNAVQYIKECIDNKRINISQARSYLKYFGLNNSAMDAIMNSIKNGTTYNTPHAWYDLNYTTVFVDVPMHLLFLGIVKSVMLKIGMWLRSNNMGAYFITSVKGILGKVKEFNVEWCKMLEYPTTDKTGGWVSENFLGMARIGNWFYSMLRFLPIQQKYEDPDSHYSTWSKTQCEKWLQARGLNKTGKISELLNIITEYHESNSAPNIISKNEISINDILTMISSMCLLIQMIMCLETKATDIPRIEAIIRMFLIHYDKVDSGMIDGSVPTWIKQYNILCLLNIPKAMNNFGHLRNLWEGGRDGEGYLKTVKSHLTGGLVNEWQTWVLTNLLKEEIYEDWKPAKTLAQNIRNEVKIYGKYQIAKDAFESGYPFSAIMVQHRIYVCFRNKGIIKANCIELSNKKENDKNQIYYSLNLTKKLIIIDQTRHSYIGVIFLPELIKEGYDLVTTDRKYCYVRSDWL